MAQLLRINSVSQASGTLQKCTFHLDRPISGAYQLVGCQVPYLEPPVVKYLTNYYIHNIDKRLVYDYIGNETGIQPSYCCIHT